jgi:uncharacterized protein
MLFKRRNPLSPAMRLRLALMPNRSFSRSVSYFRKRVLRLSATPHAIAAGVAAGAVGNPLTFPLIFAATHRLGRTILGDAPLAAGPGPLIGETVLEMEKSVIWEPILKPMLVGAVPLGLFAGLVLYIATHVAVSVFQKRRSQRLERKRAALAPLLSVARPA